MSHRIAAVVLALVSSGLVDAALAGSPASSESSAPPTSPVSPTSAVPPEAAKDDAMIALATHSGCLTCHAVKSSSPSGDGSKPIGPAWQDVAMKYKGQKDAVRTLTSMVMGGSNPYTSHWKDKVTGLAMPPNAVAISKADARRLVKWILSLGDRGT